MIFNLLCLHLLIHSFIYLFISFSYTHRCLKDLLPAEAGAKLTTAQVRYELMEAFEDVFPSMELIVQEKKGLGEGGVEEVVLPEEDGREEVV